MTFMTSWSEYVWNGLIWNKWIYNKSSHIIINDQNSFYINTFYHFILINSLDHLSNMVTWRWLYSMFPHAKPYIHINTRNYLHVHHSANGMYLWTHFITKCHDTFHAFSSYLCTPTLHHKHTHPSAHYARTRVKNKSFIQRYKTNRSHIHIF